MLKRRFLEGVCSFATLFLLSGCNVGPTYVRPKLVIPKGTSKADVEVKAFLVDGWWRIFKDPVLDNLERQALKNNSDIKIAVANIDEAAALLKVAGADNFPEIGLGATGAQAGIVKTKNSDGTVKTRSYSYGANATAKYEFDFFGKYYNGDEAAKANLLAQRANKEVVLLTVTSNVAKTYFSIRAYDAKLAIARRTLKTRQESYQVYKSRFKSGYCTELDYLRVKAEMDAVQSQILGLESAIAKAENALSIFIGTSPRDMVHRVTDKSTSIEKLRIPTVIPTELPSNLLMRRPDVVMAEQNLISANARVGEAVAANFPSFSLTGMFGFSGASMGQVFTPATQVWQLAQGFSMPIFTGFKLEGQGEAAKARYRIAEVMFKKSVSGAFRETLDVLIDVKKSSEIVESRGKEVESYQRSFQIASKQKESGLIGLLDLLDVERGLLNKEMELTDALLNQLDALVDLCKALGGGWCSNSNKNKGKAVTNNAKKGGKKQEKNVKA